MPGEIYISSNREKGGEPSEPRPAPHGYCPDCNAPNKLSKRGNPYCGSYCWAFAKKTEEVEKAKRIEESTKLVGDMTAEDMIKLLPF